MNGVRSIQGCGDDGVTGFADPDRVCVGEFHTVHNSGVSQNAAHQQSLIGSQADQSPHICSQCATVKPYRLATGIQDIIAAVVSFENKGVHQQTDTRLIVAANEDQLAVGFHQTINPQQLCRA